MRVADAGYGALETDLCWVPHGLAGWISIVRAPGHFADWSRRLDAGLPKATKVATILGAASKVGLPVLFPRRRT